MLIVRLVIVLGLVSGCGRYPGIEQEIPPGCWPCENIPEEWFWDVDDDGQYDFEVVCWSYSFSMLGGSSTPPNMSIRSIHGGSSIDPIKLLYPLEHGQWISSHTEWSQYYGVILGNAVCGEFGYWEGPFAVPEGDIFAFRIEGPEKTRVGVARFQLSECDGYIDILNLRIESELYGIIVGE